MSPDWTASRVAFAAAAGWFAGCVPLAHGRWQDPGLGEWTVRDLVGHTSRALATVETYLAVPADRVEAGSAVAYVRRALAGDPSAVADRGREAGRGLGDDPVAAVGALTERVLARVAGAGADDLLTTAAGGMRLRDYLPTRTLELVVHTCDLLVALGRRPEPPALAAEAALDVVAALAVDGGDAGALLLAATGRGGLPDGFTVLRAAGDRR